MIDKPNILHWEKQETWDGLWQMGLEEAVDKVDFVFSKGSPLTEETESFFCT